VTNQYRLGAHHPMQLWLEMDNGPLAGLPFAEAEARYPWPAFRTPYAPFFESGESDWAIHTRATHAVARLVQHGPGRTLVVAHGGILNAALRHIVGAPPPVNRQGVHFALADAGYACASYDPERHQWWLTELSVGEEAEGPAAGRGIVRDTFLWSSGLSSTCSAGGRARSRRRFEPPDALGVVGGPERVQHGLGAFLELTGVDELMVRAQIFDHQARLRSFELVAVLDLGDAVADQAASCLAHQTSIRSR
jgi:broad specificity phosphatase PhoE